MREAEFLQYDGSDLNLIKLWCQKPVAVGTLNSHRCFIEL